MSCSVWPLSLLEAGFLCYSSTALAGGYSCVTLTLTLSQQNNRLFTFLSELMDLFVAGRDQSAADQPNNLAEGHPPL